MTEKNIEANLFVIKLIKEKVGQNFFFFNFSVGVKDWPTQKLVRPRTNP